jgi:alpha-beta hydrolase superfamily lysophospholipase
MTREYTGSIDRPKDVPLFYRSRTVGEPSAGRLLAVHGLGEHSGRLEPVATCAVATGMDFHALDLRGHGRSAGKRGHAPSFERLLADLDDFRRRVSDGRPIPTVLLGHSLGALLVGRYVQEYAFPNLAGAVLAAPFVQLALEPPGWKSRLGALADRIIPRLTLDNEIDVDMLFRDEAEAREWERDPLVHQQISARLWGEMQRNAVLLVRRAPQVRTPVMVQLAGEDHVVRTEAGRALAARFGGPVETREYEGAFHDLFHDPASERALADLSAWLRAVAGTGGAESRGDV